MRQHVGHRRSVGEYEAYAQVGRRCEYEPSPSLADVREVVPPALAMAPSLPREHVGIYIDRFVIF